MVRAKSGAGARRLVHVVAAATNNNMNDAAVLAAFDRGTITDKTYGARLKAARTKFAQGRFGLNAANPLLDILTRPGALTYAQLREVYPQVTSRKNFITTLLVAYTRLPALASGSGKAVSEFWKDAHDTADMAVRILGSDNMPTQTQVAVYTSMADIKAKYKELSRASPSSRTLTDWMQYLLISFCATGHRPKRNDLGGMPILRNPVGGDPMLRDQNYVVITTDDKKPASAYFVYTKYKTAKTHSRVEEVMSDAMLQDVLLSLSAFPREHLFVNRFLQPYANNDAYGKFVRRTFENLFGKAMGTTMWRHVYISEALDLHEMSMAERQAEARLMMHTPALQERYNFGRASLCAALCPVAAAAATDDKKRK